MVKIPCWEPGVLSSMMVDKASEIVRQDDRGTYSRDMPHWGLALQKTFYPWTSPSWKDPSTVWGTGNKNLYTNQSSSDREHSLLWYSVTDSYLATGHGVLDKIIFAENNTFVLAVVPSPNTVHLPYTLTLCWTIGAPGLPTGGIQHTARSETSRQRERARVMGNESGISGAKHERVEGGCCTRPILSISSNEWNSSARTDMWQMQISIVVELMQGRQIYISSMGLIHNLFQISTGNARNCTNLPQIQ